MANKLTFYALNRLNDYLWGNTGFSPPSTFYVRLFTTAMAQDGTGGTELSGNNYSATSVTNNTTMFPSSSSGSKTNGSTVTLPTPSSTGWVGVKQVAWFDAPTGGNCWAIADVNGGSGSSFLSGATVTLNTNDCTFAIT